MHNIKSFIAIFDVFFTALWGMCLIDLLPLAGVPSVLPFVDVWIQKAISFVGLIGLSIRVYNYYHSSKITREIKKNQLDSDKEELRKIKFENRQREKSVN